jgi:hypothetical protein
MLKVLEYYDVQMTAITKYIRKCTVMRLVRIILEVTLVSIQK